MSAILTEKWYVIMTRPATKGDPIAHFPIAGPFETMEEAAPWVWRAAIEAGSVDGRMIHYGFGVARKEAETHPAGTLNQRLGLPT